ncbi:MAG: phosphatidylglycerophosphatase A [Desulfobacterales bacterium]|nr:phosphatidylglycerophosphatase A [Desulfobacterales bacterium]
MAVLLRGLRVTALCPARRRSLLRRRGGLDRPPPPSSAGPTPAAIVVDEVCGQLIALAFLPRRLGPGRPALRPVPLF